MTCTRETPFHITTTPLADIFVQGANMLPLQNNVSAFSAVQKKANKKEKEWSEKK